VTRLADRARSVLAPVLSYRTPLEVARGAGTSIFDTEGREYLDFGTGIAVLNLGHNHPDVVAAVRDQIEHLWHAGWGTYLHEPLVKAAERLVSVTPDSIEQVVFLNSGAEAVEGSVKLARKTSGRPIVIVFRGGFHGRTMGSVSYTTSKAHYRQGYHPVLASVMVAPFPHPHRWGMSQEDADNRAIEDLHLMLKHDVTPGEVAALLVEPLQGEGGYHPGSPRFLGELRRVADEHGILLILDEVQTGFGRTGAWFAADRIGVRPDILVMGKALANGFPLSAIGSSREIFSRWEPGSHGTTFGGHPVACAAAVANIDALQSVVPGVEALSTLAFERFHKMAAAHPTVGDVRGLGLMIGVELETPDGAPNRPAFEAVAAHALEEGVFILPCGTDGNVIRFIPPLNVSLADLDRGLAAVESGLAAYERTL
jgi:4-aminobutyrate aminotransferase